MPYYFYKTLEQLQNKVDELEIEFQELEKRLDKISLTKQNSKELDQMSLELENLRTKIKYFSMALTNRIRGSNNSGIE